STTRTLPAPAPAATPSPKPKKAPRPRGCGIAKEGGRRNAAAHDEWDRGAMYCKGSQQPEKPGRMIGRIRREACAGAREGALRPGGICLDPGIPGTQRT